jgi:DNA-binding transcriptional regulator YiaG
MDNPTPEEIRELRTAYGLTQAQFGEIVSAARRTVEDWEAGRRNMPAPKFELARLKLKRRPKKQP